LDRGLKQLNELPSKQLEEQFLDCCGSINWANRMMEEQPFATVEELLKKAESVWWSLNQADWLEAFRSHPKIGEQKATEKVSTAAQKWSKQEQSGVNDAAPDTRRELAHLNQQYERKFGYIYIVCATGKSPEEMLSILKHRMDNAPAEELRVAAAEQAKITELRLKKLLEQ
jgi:OHCU decarboxylase